MFSVTVSFSANYIAWNPCQCGDMPCLGGGDGKYAFTSEIMLFPTVFPKRTHIVGGYASQRSVVAWKESLWITKFGMQTVVVDRLVK
jgi:hypothetical protein